jgi:signal peptidase I
VSGPEGLGPESPHSASPSRARPRRRWLVGLGFVLAVVSMVLGLLVALFPIGIGILLATTGRRNAGIAIVVTTVVLVAVPRLILIVGLDAKAYRVPSSAMEPTMSIGDRFLAIGDETPERGDIFVFNPPAGAESDQRCGAPHPAAAACARPTPERATETSFVKRVIGLPGERVKIVGNRAYVNGSRLRESYVRTLPCTDICNLPREITIPPDHYFLLGDNRGESDDSRDWGPVPKAWMLRRAALRYRPLGRFGSL